ncbi:MAG: DUF5677 domain-containing protein [Castellaniella sp.]|uniref:DUF5677 domain-containing protein n=1 Tax=Castellaniella sp. TaxID=1955812 RepID=UPI002A36D877|nr:DUF5677 domain-containing protein [Castellaniella sp.]MDY0309745.1 DUF5677 domain-containing protein [Castellaniella sp.]
MSKKKGARRKSKYRDYNYSKLSGHKREGSKLRPPFMQMEKVQMSSWTDDHLPPMLWAALICAIFPREQYLSCFRAILENVAKWFADGGVAFEAPSESADSEDMMYFSTILDLDALAKLPDEQFEIFLQIPLQHPLGYAALRPLILLDSIPGVDRWRHFLDAKPDQGDWMTLAKAMEQTIDHQSEASTDIRWFKVMLPILAGRVKFGPAFEECIHEFFEFPNRGDMRKVRPSIRSMEMTFRRKPGEKWISDFWQECSDKTICLDPTDPTQDELTSTALESANILSIRHEVLNRFMECRTSVRTDSRLDSSFGLVLYALAIIDEIRASQCHKGILGRLGLRSLVEAYVTLRYLCQKDDEKLWSGWRIFGAGQAKLAFLKAQEEVGDLPGFIDEDALHQIANEDKWQEFLDIDIGHWAKANLRTLAQQCGAKEIYDKYYSWSSTFVHSHWGAVRDTNFITCQNPLHRLHRIPRVVHRHLTSMESDAVVMVNEMLHLLDVLYPTSQPISQIAISSAERQDVVLPK